MRWIFITLLLVNGVYFSWGVWSQRQAETKSSVQVQQVAGQSLVLLSEQKKPKPESLPPSSSKLALVPEAEPRQESVDAVNPQQEEVLAPECYLVGPIDDEPEAEALADSLRLMNFSARAEELDETYNRQYWVVIPPAPNKGAAMAELRRLQAKKMDSYLIASGDLSNAISLGVFNSERSAKVFQKKMIEEGFDVQVHEKMLKKREFGVAVAPGQSIENIKKSILAFGYSPTEIKKSNTACEKFAQPQ